MPTFRTARKSSASPLCCVALGGDRPSADSRTPLQEAHSRLWHGRSTPRAGVTYCNDHQRHGLTQLVSDGALDAAFEWLCRRRKDFPAHDDVWSLRRNWPSEKARIRAQLSACQYRFSPLSRITLANGEEVDLWSAPDALVLKALSLVLAGSLPISPHCTHVKGHGGGKAAVRQVARHLSANRFVLRTDVKSYYASIGHFLLLDQLATRIQERPILNLIGQYLRRRATRAGLFWEYDRGISLGCPLSPLIGAFFPQGAG